MLIYVDDILHSTKPKIACIIEMEISWKLMQLGLYLYAMTRIPHTSSYYAMGLLHASKFL